MTTNDELFKAAHGALSEMTPRVKEALRSREALHAGVLSLDSRPLTVQTAVDI
ncbi:hypothetical protein M0E87_09570 [Corynebacterium sp. CCM 9185]|uniref:hypothetical protein n=1 Tax=Corynebacterium marambiense TaxID=2765364 RepID=UPI002002B3B1|nr:hypothetical protein [Corynebacterium marambiense]MCK7663903.1 hypothetical protein [Corynebacterium marambiense]MCX7543052.1 hypothetical protein [Corynebacterium marambiense]